MQEDVHILILHFLSFHQSFQSWKVDWYGSNHLEAINRMHITENKKTLDVCFSSSSVFKLL